MSKASASKEKMKTSEKKSELDVLRQQLARALADYDNLRKRFEREQKSIIKLANSVLVAKLLPIIDALDKAQSHLNDSGLAMSISELRRVLKEEGVEEIDVKQGDKFDENMCEAVEVIQGDEESDGKIAEVVLPGWRINDGGIIRHAKVKVFRKEAIDKGLSEVKN